MITWDEFLESIEKDEEKTGLDLDHDKEKGEDPRHVAKLKKKKEEMLTFFKARKEGAEKIAREAKQKGGPAILTYWHFSAKSKPYNEVIKAIKEDKNETYFKSKCRTFMLAVRCGSMTQNQIQKTLGEVEVWAEALAQIFT